MCNISSASHFIDSDMSDNDVPIGNDNVEEAEGENKIAHSSALHTRNLHQEDSEGEDQ